MVLSSIKRNLIMYFLQHLGSPSHSRKTSAINQSYSEDGYFKSFVVKTLILEMAFDLLRVIRIREFTWLCRMFFMYDIL